MVAVTQDLFSQLELYAASDKTEPQNSDNLISEIHQMISNNSQLNVDLFDVGTVLKCTGKALAGIGESKSENRAIEAASEALEMNNDQSLSAKSSKIALMSIMTGPDADFEMDELTEMTNYVIDKLSENTELIFGHSLSEELGESIKVLLLVSMEE